MSSPNLTWASQNAGGIGLRLARQVNAHSLTPIGVLAAVFLGFAWVEPRMVSLENVANIGLQASLLFIVTVAQLLPIIVRGFDLSIGTVVSLASVLCSMTVVFLASDKSGPVIVVAALFVALATGLSVGLVNGIAISRMGVDPFVTTLATFNVCLGLALTASEGVPIADLPTSFTSAFAGSQWLGVPIPVAAAAIVLIIGHILLRHTVLGRSLYLVGSNPNAARVAGIRVRSVTFVAYVGAGLLASLSALLLTARVGSGEPTLGGAALTIQSIVAVVVGGTSLAGGSGTVWNCLAGALVVTILSNGMNLVRINGFAQPMVLGALIVIAAFVASRQRVHV